MQAGTTLLDKLRDWRIRSSGLQELERGGTGRQELGANTLGRHVFRRLDLQAFVVGASHPPEPVDVALDDVAAERLAGQQRRLDVDLHPGLQAPERAATERLRDDVEVDCAVIS